MLDLLQYRKLIKVRAFKKVSSFRFND